MATFEDFVDEYDDVQDTEDEIDVRGDRRAFLSSSDWTVDTLLAQLTQENIDLRPQFQRRSVWDDRRASRFIESVFLGLPIPQLMLAEDKGREGGFLVLDGKQRLLTLARFASSSASETEQPAFERLRLTGLDQLPELDGKTIDEIDQDPTLMALVRRFRNQTIRTVVIAGWPDEDWLNLVFLRLNSGSVPLSGQELRQALNPGEFSGELNRFAAGSESLHRALGLSEPDFRMRDTELALRFLAFHLFLDEYSGILKTFLDRTTQKLNAQWPAYRMIVFTAFTQLDSAIETAESVHGDDAFHRYNGLRYENRFNRAVFDLQTQVYAVPAVATIVRDFAEPLRIEFARLCVEDRAFSEALQATTKSIESTYLRLDTWVESVNRICGLHIERPELAIAGAGRPRISWGHTTDGLD